MNTVVGCRRNARRHNCEKRLVVWSVHLDLRKNRKIEKRNEEFSQFWQTNGNAIDSLTRSICFHFFFNEFNLAAWILTDLTPRVDFFFLFTAGDSGYFSSSFIWLTHIQRRQFRFPFSFFRPCALFQGFKQQLLISSLPLRLPRVDKLWIFSPPSVLFFCFLLTFHHQFMYSDSCRCNHRSIEILIFLPDLHSHAHTPLGQLMAVVHLSLFPLYVKLRHHTVTPLHPLRGSPTHWPTRWWMADLRPYGPIKLPTTNKQTTGNEMNRRKFLLDCGGHGVAILILILFSSAVVSGLSVNVNISIKTINSDYNRQPTVN